MKLARREQVQSPAHGPGFDERAVVPQGPADGVAYESLGARPEGQLGGRHHLGVKSAQGGGDVEHGASGCAAGEVLPVEAPGCNLGPSEHVHKLRLCGARKSIVIVW